MDARERALLDVVWRAGDLSYLLHAGQLDLRRAWCARRARRFVLNIARRYGKSFWLCVEGVEECVSQPGHLVRYAAPTAKMVRTIIEPHMRRILADAPEDMRPQYARQEGIWRFPNGSELHVAGCDNGGAERLRGTDTHLGLVDEAAFVDDLPYLVEDILMPQTITTDGRLLISSTPARTPAHPFARYCREAEERDTYVHRTIYDAPHISAATLEEYMEEAGGQGSSTWRREYMAEHVVDDELAVVPEFSAFREVVVEREIARPDFYRPRVALDVGFHDMSVAVFGYLDFPRGVAVIEDEVVGKRMRSTELDRDIAAKERALWGDRSDVYRVADASDLVLAEMHSPTRSWSKARNDDLAASVNDLRRCIPNRLRIHERCKTTIAHTHHAVWNTRRSGFERTEEHHFDGLAAAMYFIRHMDWNENPFPLLPGRVTEENWHIPAKLKEKRGDAAALRSIFRRH